ncbi:MAG TPA: LD-carboxypeptidase [Acidisarcina sp.]
MPPAARIAVVSPASAVRGERIDDGIRALRALGYKVTEGAHSREKSPPYFSGTVEERLADLHDAFADPGVNAIICNRGGYGSNYLLEHLDLDLIRANPKPLFGYSDLTAIQTWLLDKVNLVSFHGPMVSADFCRPNGVHLASFIAAVSGEQVNVGPAEGLGVLRPGVARGVFYGGCLSLLAASLATPFAAKTEGTLLFIEDVAAKPYQVDRMLRQLILAGKLDGVTGIIFGEMLDCVSLDPAGIPIPGLLEAVILRVLDWFDGPIAFGLRSGHASASNVTLPLGIEAELNLNQEPMLTFLESAVQVS